ncbi:MAG: hydroxymethylglutaryl-CoA lyase [Rhodospirillales bacterium]
MAERAERAVIFEVGPRDGLQNEPRLIPVQSKVRLIDMLSACGFEKIEAASFVSPKWTPQMADAEAVMANITRAPGVAYTALTPNLKGYERAHAAGVDEIALTASASEGFSQKNINRSIAESLDMFRPAAAAARAGGVPVRGYVSCVVACPYDGPTPPAAAARVTEQLLAMGCYEISLGDTIGAGTPETIDAMLAAVLEAAPPEKLAGHYHDTGGRALANIEASLKRGLRTFDAAAGGLGGCPYAPGAKGNVATEAAVRLLAERGFETGIDEGRLAEAAAYAISLRSTP